MKRMNIIIGEELYVQLRQFAFEHTINMSAVARRAIKKYLREFAKEKGEK